MLNIAAVLLMVVPAIVVEQHLNVTYVIVHKKDAFRGRISVDT